MADYVVPPVVNTPSSDNSEWNWDWARDGNAILNKGGWSLLGKACGAYVKGSERKADYHLPHHKMINGKLTVVKGGVRAAMQRLKRTIIPLAVKKQVHGHLAGHYKHFDMKVPPFEEILSADEREQWNVLSTFALEFLVKSLVKELNNEFSIDEELLEFMVEQTLDVADLGALLSDREKDISQKLEELTKYMAGIIGDFLDND